MHPGDLLRRSSAALRDRDLREISEADLLEYIRLKLDAGQKPAAILTALSVLRRVLNLAARDGLIARNPANGLAA